MANHRYWRIRCPDTYVAGEYLGLTEVEMRATVGGIDRTTGKTATASANAGSPYFPATAIDDSLTSFWTTGATAPPAGGHWLMVDFTADPLDVAEISVKVRPDTFREDPAELILEWSDTGSAPWTEAIHQSGIAAWTAGEVRLFTPPGPQVVLSKATLQVVRGMADTIHISKATLQVVRKEPDQITITKATLQVVRKEPDIITITKASLQVVSGLAPLVPPDERRRMSLM